MEKLFQNLGVMGGNYSQGKGRYAVKTLLGWIVNLQSCESSTKSLTVNRISAASLEEVLISQYN